MRNFYRQSKCTNDRIRSMLEELNLPTNNRYVFTKAFLQKAGQLQHDKRYLILLSLFWSPIGHLLGTARTVVDDFEESTELHKTLTRYEELEPACYKKLMTFMQDFKAFNLDIHPDSLNLPLRLNEYQALLMSQKAQHNEFKSWRSDYDARRPNMRAETLALHRSEQAKSPDSQLVLDLLRIFHEYVTNLTVDSKNRTKYQVVLERVSSYIHAFKSELEEEDSAVDDFFEADDAIGSIFTQILRNAIDYPALAPIGPAYICWLFKNRIFKIGNPTKEDVNLLLVNSKKEELFRLNTDWHRSPSIPDQAQIYLFDELCALWEKYDLGSIKLSCYLFERSMPYYRDFIRADFKMPPEKPVLTHRYVSYDVSSFTNEFLQLSLSAIDLTFSPKNFYIESRVDEDSWKSFLTAPENDDHGFSLLEHHFAQTKELIALASSSRRSPVRINIHELFCVVYNLLSNEENEKFIKTFEQVFLLSPYGCGCNFLHESWVQKINSFFASILEEVEDRFVWKISHQDLWEEMENIVSVEYGHFVFDAVLLICSKKLHDSYLAQIMSFSKQAFFETYTEEQYTYLEQFLHSLEQPE